MGFFTALDKPKAKNSPDEKSEKLNEPVAILQSKLYPENKHKLMFKAKFCSQKYNYFEIIILNIQTEISKHALSYRSNGK